MNCRRIAELIPLYVEADLAERELGRVRSHLQTCAACRAQAAEYEASQAWLRASASPDFDEAFVDTVRLGVMRELAASAAGPSLFERLQMWLAPRRLAAATVALIVVFVTLAFFILQSRSRLNHQDNEMATDAPAPTVEKKPEDMEPAPGAKPETARQSRRRTPRHVAPLFAYHSRRNIRHVSRPQDDVLAQQLLNARPAVLSNNRYATENDDMLRIDFQTADPNIRIIWFAPKQIDDAPNPMGETR